jgi:hypothetical protein
MTDDDGKIHVLIEIVIDPKRFDLTPYTQAAVDDGWADDPENGADYLAQEICGDYAQRGCRMDICP